MAKGLRFEGFLCDIHWLVTPLLGFFFFPFFFFLSLVFVFLPFSFHFLLIGYFLFSPTLMAMLRVSVSWIIKDYDILSSSKVGRFCLKGRLEVLIEGGVYLFIKHYEVSLQFPMPLLFKLSFCLC